MAVCVGLLGKGLDRVGRMKAASFTKTDVRFVESLLSSVYPISGPQKAQCERAWDEPTAESSFEQRTFR